MFLACPLATILWQESPWPIYISAFSGYSIQEWIRLILNPKSFFQAPSIPARDFLLFAGVAMDCLWFARNEVAHKNTQVSSLKLVVKVKKNLLSHQEAWGDLVSSSLVVWKPSPRGSIKINFDVAIRKSHSMAPASCCDHSGKVLFAWMKILPSADPSSGEGSLALLGL